MLNVDATERHACTLLLVKRISICRVRHSQGSTASSRGAIFTRDKKSVAYFLWSIHDTGSLRRTAS